MTIETQTIEQAARIVYMHDPKTESFTGKIIAWETLPDDGYLKSECRFTARTILALALPAPAQAEPVAHERWEIGVSHPTKDEVRWTGEYVFARGGAEAAEKADDINYNGLLRLRQAPPPPAGEG